MSTWNAADVRRKCCCCFCRHRSLCIFMPVITTIWKQTNKFSKFNQSIEGSSDLAENEQMHIIHNMKQHLYSNWLPFWTIHREKNCRFDKEFSIYFWCDADRDLEICVVIFFAPFFSLPIMTVCFYETKFLKRISTKRNDSIQERKGEKKSERTKSMFENQVIWNLCFNFQLKFIGPLNGWDCEIGQKERRRHTLN